MAPISRRTVAVIAAVVIAVAGVAVVAYLAGRSQSAAPPTAPASSRQVVATPDAATSSQVSTKPALPRGGATAGEGGTTTGPADLPLGYSHDEDGAVTAATNYLMWMNSIKIADKQAADEMAAAVAADSATEALLVQSFDQIRTGLESLTDDRLEPARGAYAIKSYDDNRATVYVWAPEVTTDVNGVTEHLWAVDEIHVVWVDGDWKLDQELIAATGATAVDPADPTGHPTTAEKRAILARTPADPGEITDTAEQTWFEYANAPR